MPEVQVDEGGKVRFYTLGEERQEAALPVPQGAYFL